MRSMTLSGVWECKPLRLQIPASPSVRVAGCHLELPVSTTHTTVGAIVGMSLVLQGAGAVAWNARTDEFPFFTGISTVVASWCASLEFSAHGSKVTRLS